jgi:hypothetical protein
LCSFCKFAEARLLRAKMEMSTTVGKKGTKDRNGYCAIETQKNGRVTVALTIGPMTLKRRNVSTSIPES